MKSITFRPCGTDYITYFAVGLFSDYGIKLSFLAEQGDLFKLLQNSSYFRVVIDGRRIYGYTDKYGNKILRYSSSLSEKLSDVSCCRKRNK